MPRIDLNDTPYEGPSRSFTVLEGGKSWPTCRHCGSTIYPERFESSGVRTIGGSTLSVDVYRCGCGRGHEVRRAAE